MRMRSEGESYNCGHRSIIQVFLLLPKRRGGDFIWFVLQTLQVQRKLNRRYICSCMGMGAMNRKAFLLACNVLYLEPLHCRITHDGWLAFKYYCPHHADNLCSRAASFGAWC